jgi:hypothetical protein
MLLLVFPALLPWACCSMCTSALHNRLQLVLVEWLGRWSWQL